jgi:hypothetical protein
LQQDGCGPVVWHGVAQAAVKVSVMREDGRKRITRNIAIWATDRLTPVYPTFEMIRTQRVVDLLNLTIILSLTEKARLPSIERHSIPHSFRTCYHRIFNYQYSGNMGDSLCGG